MNIIQLCQILFVALIGAFALIVTLNNVRDPQSNLRLAEHLLSMDTVFPDTRLKSRAVASPLAHRIAFGLIVAAQGAVALWFGGFMVIGGQWFASWQSKQWNGRESAFMFYSAIGIAFLALLHQA
jgi:predicted small integral membrane protein